MNATAKKVLYEILCDAFGLTIGELSTLPLKTSLVDLYDRFPQFRGDNYEFETLQRELEREIGRNLTDDELRTTLTIADVLHLIDSGE